MAKINAGIGALIAAAAGFVTGILLAPKSGADTRKDIKNEAVKAKKAGIEKVEEVKGKASDVANDVAEKAKEVVGDVSGKAKHVADDVTAKAEQIKGRVERTIEGAQKGYETKSKPATKKK